MKQKVLHFSIKKTIDSDYPFAIHSLSVHVVIVLFVVVVFFWGGGVVHQVPTVSSLNWILLWKVFLCLYFDWRIFLLCLFFFSRNPGYRTIEDDLLNAMLRADLVTEEGCTCPQLFNFQRAARTDKGVSAARQVVSVKLRKILPIKFS